MQPTKPFAVISESFSITTEITLNCKLAELKKQLNHHRDDLLIHVRGGFASNRYQKATNYDYLSDEAEKGSASRSIYIVQAKELTLEIREHCIPIQLNPAEACSATIVKTLTLSTGHSKNVRLRSINRSFVNGYGRRDITTIST